MKPTTERMTMERNSQGNRRSVINKNWRTRIAYFAVSLSVCAITLITAPFAAADVVLGQVDDFEDATTQGWQEGAVSPNVPSNISDGGPAGAGDNYLQDVSAGGFGGGSKMTAFNPQATWTGNYISAGIKKVCADAKVENTSDSALSLRLAFHDTTTTGFASNTPVIVPNDGIWRSVAFPVSPNSLVLGNGTPTYNGTMTNVLSLRVFHAAATPNWRLAGAIAATMGLDNIRAWGSGGDMGNDCRSDIIWRNTATGQNLAYHMNGAEIASSVGINKVVGGEWKIVGNGDYNGDGIADMLWRNGITGRNWMYLMNASGIQSSEPVNTLSDVSWKVVGNGDYDGDGNDDIMWRHQLTYQVVVYFMTGSSFSAMPIDLLDNTRPDNEWIIAHSGDFNRDGMDDLLWCNKVTGQSVIYLMNGAVIGSKLVVATISNLDWLVVATGDYNGDGITDLLWRNHVTGSNWMYLMDGDGTAGFQSAGVNTVPGDVWGVVGSGDYNGDGNDDILWRNSATGQNWMYLMTGANIDQSIGINTVPGPDWQVIYVD